ncbi:MAG: hypothetical protein IPP41_14725 [Rhodocyclaceae bacterium]|nr:hypothetical protein [Rhodocyclaceae bacterium]
MKAEIAQSERCNRQSPYAQFWLHIGMVMFEGEKMSSHWKFNPC